MSTASRKFHLKTRTGCKECRRRHTKCDEAKPSCGSCTRRELKCSFVDDTSGIFVVPSKYVASSSTAQPTTGNATPPPHADPTGTPYLSPAQEIELAVRYALRNDLHDTSRLLTHFLISTCYSISDSSSNITLWRETVPALAFEYPCLLAGIYAVSALHLALIQPSGEHNNAAFEHHNNALSLFAPQLENMTPYNVSALFAFSCLIPLYSFGVHNVSPVAGLVTGPLFEINEVFTLLRGITVIVKGGMEWLQNGPFKDSVLLRPPDASVKLSPQVTTALAALSDYNEESSQDLGMQEAYTVAIKMLRVSFLLAAERPGLKMVIFPFPIFAPETFIQKLKEGEPMALVILAHYAVILHWLNQYIWLHGWGKRLVLAIHSSVGEKWSTCLKWALSEIADEKELEKKPI